MTGPLSAWRAALVYTLAAVAMSWPLLPQIHRSMAGDLGDPLLNAWILTWGAKHATAILGGDLGAFARWWNANIFHPSPLALAYSEHLTPLVLLGLPVWWITKNALLVYNLLYLASAVLSGPRDVSSRPRAHGTAARGAGRGSLLRVRALPHRADAAPPGAVVAVDAVHALRVPLLSRSGTHRRAGGRRCRAARAAAVVRLLPCLLQSVRRALPRMGTDGTAALARRAPAAVARPRRDGRPRPGMAVSFALPEAARAGLPAAVDRRGRELLGGHDGVLRRPRDQSRLGPDSREPAAPGERAVPGAHPARDGRARHRGARQVALAGVSGRSARPQVGSHRVCHAGGPRRRGRGVVSLHWRRQPQARGRAAYPHPRSRSCAGIHGRRHRGAAAFVAHARGPSAPGASTSASARWRCWSWRSCCRGDRSRVRPAGR